MSLEAKKVHAPWDRSVVHLLRQHQLNGKYHPYICGNRDKHASDLSNDILIPTEKGWVCPSCSYTQDWAWRPVNVHDR